MIVPNSYLATDNLYWTLDIDITESSTLVSVVCSSSYTQNAEETAFSHMVQSLSRQLYQNELHHVSRHYGTVATKPCIISTDWRYTAQDCCACGCVYCIACLHRESSHTVVPCDAAGTSATPVVWWTARAAAVPVPRSAMPAMTWSTPPTPDSSATVAQVSPGMFTVLALSQQPVCIPLFGCCSQCQKLQNAMLMVSAA